MDSTEYIAGMLRESRLRWYAANGEPSGLYRWYIMHPRSIGFGGFALVMAIWTVPVSGGGGLLRGLSIGFLPGVIGGLFFAGLSAAEKRVYEEWSEQQSEQPGAGQ